MAETSTGKPDRIDIETLLRVRSQLAETRSEVSTQRDAGTLDEPGVRRALAHGFNSAMATLRTGIEGEIAAEAGRLFPDLTTEATAGEVRVAYTQATGWLKGVEASVAAAMTARQIAGQIGAMGGQVRRERPTPPAPQAHRGAGPYL